MHRKFNRHYRYALYSSLYITLIISALAAGFMYYFQIPLWIVFFFSAFSYIICFAIIQYFTQRLIYQKIHDIYKTIFTDLNIYDERLITNIDSLSKEVERFSEDKRLQIEDLKVRDDFRKEFIGNLAHELKTPLFTAQSYLLTLQDGAVENMKVRDKYLERSAQSIERMVHLVEDLDTITKLETGKETLSKEKMDLVALTQTVFDMLEVVAEEKKISLTFDTDYNEPIYVFADSKKIHHILTNLTLNSIKYGKRYGTTEVAFDKIENKIIIRISDNGEGIAKNHLPRLFERFYRVDKSGSRKEGGSGLGLAIVKHMIEAHKERIQVESEIGLGTEFSFTLEQFQENL